MWDRLHEKKPDNTFLKIMANKRIRSAIYLVLWFIAIWIIYIVYLKPIEEYSKTHPSNNTTEELENTVQEIDVSFDEKKAKLLTNNYSYIFKYNDEQVYKGDRLGTKTTGYLETKDGISRYYIEDNKEYLVSFGVLNETTFDDKFNTYFNANYLFDLIKGHYPIILDNVYSYKIDDNYVKIITDDASISSIEVSWESDIYYLEYSNIGQISSIEY